MSWARIRGHDALVKSFDAAYRKGRLGHAYLFVGPPGVGKRTFALELAKAVLCDAPADGLAACDKCASCSLVAAQSHPDLILACRPEDKVEFPIATIRNLTEHLSLKAARGNRKVAIVDDASDFNEESSNAFLKALEEPAPGSILILIGGPSPDSQLPTILSRCQVIHFQALGTPVLAELLKAHGIVDPARVERLGRMSGGSPGLAVALNDETLWAFRTMLLHALSANVVDSLALGTNWNAFIEEAGKDAGMKRRRASLVLRLLIGMLQDALRIATSVTPNVADRAESVTLRSLSERLGPVKLMEWIDRAMAADLQNDRKVQLDLIVDAFADYLGR